MNFMMLPLCTMVSDLRSLSTTYCRALRTRRWVPSLETGLMPMPQSWSKRILVTPISSFRNLMTLVASGEPAFHSIPA
ncbi:hypothetical protein D3C81_1905690 [compost metagenome]